MAQAAKDKRRAALIALIGAGEPLYDCIMRVMSSTLLPMRLTDELSTPRWEQAFLDEMEATIKALDTLVTRSGEGLAIQA